MTANDQTIKTITIRQPWATMVARGEKTHEIRTWNTAVRGEVLIHAGSHGRESGQDLPYGAIIASVRLVDCFKISDDDHAQRVRDEGRSGGAEPFVSTGVFIWVFAEARPIGPIAPIRGFPGFFETPRELIYGRLHGQSGE